jgi:hypothetical protein
MSQHGAYSMPMGAAITLRVVYALVVLTGVIWLLRDGLPLGALAVVIIAVVLLRSAEHGRVTRLAGRLAKAF